MSKRAVAECLSLLVREQDLVVKAIEAARRLIPFPMLGLDTDNGKESINHTLLDYCRREEITFTRSRPYKKNDPCQPADTRRYRAEKWIHCPPRRRLRPV